MLTEYATSPMRDFAASERAGYVAVIVALAPTVAAWHAHTEKLLGPLYFPMSARGSSDCRDKSKSDIDTRQPCGFRGASRVAASSSVRDTALHPPIGTGSSDDVNLVFHGSCARRVDESDPIAAQDSARAAMTRTKPTVSRVARMWTRE